MASIPQGFRRKWVDMDFPHPDRITQHFRRAPSSSAAPVASMTTPGDWYRESLQANDGSDVQLGTERIIRPSDANVLTVCFRVRSTNVAKSAILLGISDNGQESGGAVGGKENGTLSLVPDDCLFALLEGEQDLTWHLVGSKGGADFDYTISKAPDARNNVPQSIDMQIYKNGDVRALVDGKRASDAYVFEELINPDISYAVTFAYQGRATAYIVDMDYVGWEFSRD